MTLTREGDWSIHPTVMPRLSLVPKNACQRICEKYSLWRKFGEHMYIRKFTKFAVNYVTYVNYVK
jgi:hypothetical protein